VLGVVAVVVVVVFRQLRLPALIGYLLVGILIGPHALGWVNDSEDTRYLAEFGVVFLMFSIGLEFSLPKMVTMRRIVFGLGAAQVGVLTFLVIWLTHGWLYRWRPTLGSLMPTVAKLSRIPRTPACVMASSSLSAVFSSMTATPRAFPPRAFMPKSVAELSVP
jgi:Kef-type K+ transport system membrane component KefB